VGAGAQGARGGPGAATGPSGESLSHEARGGSGAALSQETGGGAQDTWQLWSCLEPQDGSRGHEARGSSGAPLCWEAGAGAMGHTGMHARAVFRLDSELVHGGTQSSGYRQSVLLSHVLT
jgi:hypothetical protein